jgi:hypothetical protein
MKSILIPILAIIASASCMMAAQPNGNEPSAQLGINIYPDRPVSRPAEYRKSAFESTSVLIASGDVIRRAEAFHHLAYGSQRADEKNWLLWEFNLKPGNSGMASIAFIEKYDFIRVSPSAISFEVLNLSQHPVAFDAVLTEFDWRTKPEETFTSWQTGESESIGPGETRRVFLNTEEMVPSDPVDRGPRFPMTFLIRVAQPRAEVDYKLALRDLTIHTPPARSVRVQGATATVAERGESDLIEYTTRVTQDTANWHSAYLEVRHGQKVFWRTDVASRLRDSDNGPVSVELEIPPLLPFGQYEVGLAVDGLRVAGSEVALDLGTTRQPGYPQVELRPHNGRPTVFVDGEPFLWNGYSSYEWQAGPIEDFGKLGVNLFMVPMNAGRHMHSITPPLVAEPGRLDFDPIQEGILLSLSAQPDAKIVLRISLAMPPHLLQKMPDSIVMARTPAGDIVWEETATMVGSFSSQDWRKAQAALMREVLDFVGNQPYADRVIGAVLTAGGTEEWFMYGSNQQLAVTDHSPVNAAAFAEWSRARGLPFREIPNPEERVPTDRSLAVFPDTPGGRAATAYASFMEDSLADALLYFCREAKDATEGRLLTGTMYAYLLQLAGDPRQNLSHSMNMSALLDAPEFDFFMGIPLLNYRTLKDGYDTFVTAVASAHLHGKVYVNENDLFSWLHHHIWRTPHDPEDPRGGAISMHQRVTASDVVYGNQAEWFGLFAHWHYDHEGLLQEAFAEMNEIKFAALDLDRSPEEEIALLVDDSSYSWTAPRTRMTYHQLLRTVRALGRTGAPVGVYVLSDIDRLPERIKLAVIPWAPAMAPATRAKLKAALAAGERNYYLSGPIGIVDTDPAAWRWDDEKIAGDPGLPIRLRRDPTSAAGKIEIRLPGGLVTNHEFPVRSGSPAMQWEGDGAFGFDQGDNTPIAGLLEVSGKYVWWSDLVIHDERFLLELIERSGVRRYAPPGFAIHAARGVVAVTAPETGEAAIDFGRPVRTIDLFSREFGQGQIQRWNFGVGQTRLFALQEDSEAE